MELKNPTCRILFSVYAVVFFLCGVAFVAVPHEVIATINWLGGFQSAFGPLPEEGHRLWLTLAFSMMMMISYASWLVSKNKYVRPLLGILLLSKFVSAGTYLVFLFVQEMAFGYFLGFLVDGAIFLSIFIVWRKIHPS